MKSQPNIIAVKLNCILCLNNFINYRSKKIELFSLEKIIEVTEIAMKSFPNDRELEKEKR
jgi:hypothetical protein